MRPCIGSRVKFVRSLVLILDQVYHSINAHLDSVDCRERPNGALSVCSLRNGEQKEVIWNQRRRSVFKREIQEIEYKGVPLWSKDGISQKPRAPWLRTEEMDFQEMGCNFLPVSCKVFALLFFFFSSIFTEMCCLSSPAHDISDPVDKQSQTGCRRHGPSLLVFSFYSIACNTPSNPYS